jgi:hypothetical protein
MESAQLEAFLAIYADVAGYKLSHKDRNARPEADRSFVYGEVLPESFQALMEVAQPQAGERFVDLGAGLGKAVLLAATLFPFSEVAGVEKLPSLVEAARSALARFDEALRPTLPPERRGVKVAFTEGDLREFELRQAGVVFAHSSCFDGALMAALTEKLSRELPVGARAVMVGRAVFAPDLEQVHSGGCEMDWGEANAWVFRKRG